MKDQSTPPSHGLLLIYDVITANNKIASALLTPSSVGTRMYLGKSGTAVGNFTETHQHGGQRGACKTSLFSSFCEI